MIRLDEDYYIRADDKNYMLCKQREIKTGDNAGKLLTDILSYHQTMESLIKYYMTLLVRKEIQKDRMNSVNSLIKKMREIEQKIEALNIDF